jgi:hypothetical protein
MAPPAVRATLILAMAKPPHRVKEQTHSWAVYHIRGTPARLIGIVYAPDEQSAIAKAIDEFKVSRTSADG